MNMEYIEYYNNIDIFVFVFFSLLLCSVSSPNTHADQMKKVEPTKIIVIVDWKLEFYDTYRFYLIFPRLLFPV